MAASEADLILYLIAPEAGVQDVRETLSALDASKVRVLFTKSDAGTNPDKDEIEKILSEFNIGSASEISVRDNINTDVIGSIVKQTYENAGGLNASDITVLSNRHAALLRSASSKLGSALDILNQGLGVDVCSQVIRAALNDTGEITGREVSDELAETIFAKFCIGK